MTVLLFLDFHSAENTGTDESAEKTSKKVEKSTWQTGQDLLKYQMFRRWADGASTL